MIESTRIPSTRSEPDRRSRAATAMLGLIIAALLALPTIVFSEQHEAVSLDDAQAGVIQVAQADDERSAKGSRPLEPKYQPLEPVEKSWFNGSYIFGMSRGLADSTIAPAVKAPLFLFTVPLDLAFLPFAVIGGMFG